MKYVYAGNSWSDSFPLQDKLHTNLANEWGIPYIKCARPVSNLNLLNLIKELNCDLPIVLLYSEPALDVRQITGISFKEFCQQPDWKNIREQCNQECLKKISSLNQPVLLIGGHSDVTNCDYKNITVVNSSWQKWIAEQAGMKVIDNKIHVVPADGGEFIVDNCFGAELIHKYLFEHPDMQVDPGLEEKLWDVYYFWETLTSSGWMIDNHPTYIAHKEFSKFLYNDVIKFITQ